MKNPSLEHQKLLLALLQTFRNKGLRISEAAYAGFQAPGAYGRHEPDIVAIDSSGLIHLAEAKTEDDLDSQITREQFTDFSTRSMVSDRRVVPFHIVVPTLARSKTELILSELGLSHKIGNGITVWTV